MSQEARAGARAILDWLVDREAEMADFLAELVALESPSTEPAAQEPVLRLLEGALAGCGMRSRRVRGRRSGGMLLALPRERRRGAPAQLLLGHADTVWPTGTLATMPVLMEDGLLRGPGAFDMKGGLAIMVFALRALHELGREPGLTPVVLVSTDEEIGSGDSRRWIEALARRVERVLVLEPAYGAEGRLKTSRKGTGEFEVRVYGRSAHAGLDPGSGASAIVEMAGLVGRLHALADPERGTTVNVGVIEGGARVNVVPAFCRAEVDVRVPTAEDAERLESAIRALEPETPGTRIEVSGGVDRPPLEPTPRNRRLWELARSCGRELGMELEEAGVGGGSDGNLTSPFAATLDGLGPVGDGAHADHEHVRVDSLPRRAALLARIIETGA